MGDPFDWIGWPEEAVLEKEDARRHLNNDLARILADPAAAVKRDEELEALERRASIRRPPRRQGFFSRLFGANRDDDRGDDR